MKKIISVIFLVIVSSCSNITDLNKNVKDPVTVSAQSLFTSAQKNAIDQVVNTDVNFNTFRLIMQYWTATTYTDEANYELVTRSIPLNHWSSLYRDALSNFAEAYGIVENQDALGVESAQIIKDNQLAVIEIMTVYVYSVLVDTFGDIPYSEALNEDIFLPQYDDGLTIYKDLITRLNAAISQLNPAEGSFSANADNMYQGDVSLWAKFANSLKLRMGITLADISGETAFVTETVTAAVPGVFSSNADNAALSYLANAPNTNPVHATLVLSGRSDYVAGKTIVDKLSELEDPRISAYFTESGENDGAGYSGGIIGASNAYSAFSHVSPDVTEATREGLVLTYSEVEFLLAEAVERGYAVGGTAEDHYNNAIEASIQYWGGSTEQAATYLAQTQVAYTTATGDWREKIGIQSWIALYNRGFESWTVWRRLDFNILAVPTQAISDTPVRFTYPVQEQTLNGANRAAAAATIGGDLVTTKLFWDLN